MVKINYCPSCGCKLSKGSFICPSCNLDIEKFFDKDYLLISNRNENSIELHDGDFQEIFIDEDEILGPEDLSNASCEEIVIVVPDDAGEDEIVIDLDELGIDAENLGEDINIVVQIEGSQQPQEMLMQEDIFKKANEWRFDDDPYDIVYYEFPIVD